MFGVFIDSFKNFKDMYFLVVPQSREVHESLCVLLDFPRLAPYLGASIMCR